MVCLFLSFHAHVSTPANPSTLPDYFKPLGDLDQRPVSNTQSASATETTHPISDTASRTCSPLALTFAHQNTLSNTRTRFIFPDNPTLKCGNQCDNQANASLGLSSSSKRQKEGRIRVHTHLDDLAVVHPRKRPPDSKTAERSGSHFKKARFAEDLTQSITSIPGSPTAGHSASATVGSQFSLSDVSAATSGSQCLSAFGSISDTSLSSAGSVTNCAPAGADPSEPRYIDFKKLMQSGSAKKKSALPTLLPRDVTFSKKGDTRHVCKIAIH